MVFEKIIREKHSLILRITHWLNVPVLSVMIWSGLLIYWANPVYLPIPENIGPFRIHHRLAEGMGWHFLMMWPFVVNGIVFVINLFVSGNWKELFPDNKTFQKLIPFILFDLHLNKKCPVFEGKYNPAQRVIYPAVILMGLGSIISGLAIYKPVQAGFLSQMLGGYESSRFLHFLCMSGILLFIPVHLIQVARSGWNNFRAMVAGYEVAE